MTDALTLSKAVAIWTELVAVDWDGEVAKMGGDEGAVALRHDLHYFAIVRPADTAAQFGALSPTLDASVASRKIAVGDDKPVGAYEIGLASIGNVFECLGLVIEDATWSTVRAWIPRLEVSRNDQRVFYFWDGGLLAIALGDRVTARRIAGHSGDGALPFEAGATFKMNMRGFIQHLAAAVEIEASAHDVMPAFRELVANYRRYQSGRAADEATLFWAARIVHHQLGKQRLGTTAQFLHDTIWELAGEA